MSSNCKQEWDQALFPPPKRKNGKSGIATRDYNKPLMTTSSMHKYYKLFQHTRVVQNRNTHTWIDACCSTYQHRPAPHRQWSPRVKCSVFDVNLPRLLCLTQNLNWINQIKLLTYKIFCNCTYSKSYTYVSSRMYFTRARLHHTVTYYKHENMLTWILCSSVRAENDYNVVRAFFNCFPSFSVMLLLLGIENGF